MVVLAVSQAVGIAALVFFLVVRTEPSSPFDRLMEHVRAHGPLAAIEALGPGAELQALGLCKAGAAPPGQLCTREASRYAVARRLLAMSARGCVASRTTSLDSGDLEVAVSCDAIQLKVGFELTADGLQGRPETRWPGFGSGLDTD